MKQLLQNISSCTICQNYLPFGPRPVITAHPDAKIAIIGQAPGAKVHETGIPWDDPSGKQLRKWLGITDTQFYDDRLFTLIPMGFCYPGKGNSGDLPPRPECAPQWHQTLLEEMPNITLTILIGQYAQKYYLRERLPGNLTETVRQYTDYLPEYFVMPHPSPRNRFWLRKNPWFEEAVLPELQKRISTVLNDAIY